MILSIECFTSIILQKTLKALFDPVEALVLDFVTKGGVAVADNLAINEDVDEIGLEIVEHSLVVGDDHCGGLGSAKLVEAFGHDAESIDVEAGVGLVENAEGGLEDGHLEDFVAFPLTTRKAFVDAAIHKVGVEAHKLALLAEELEEVGSAERLLVEILALGVDGGAHKIGHRDTWDFDRRLKGHKDALVATVLGRKFEEVLAVEDDFALSDLVLGIADEDITESGLTGPVWPHEDMNLTITDGKIHATEYFFAFYAGMEISNIEHERLLISLREVGFSLHFVDRLTLVFGGNGMRCGIIMSRLGLAINTSHGVALGSRDKGVCALMAVVENEAPLVVELDGVKEHFTRRVGLAVDALLHDDRDADFVEVSLAETHVFNFVVNHGEELVYFDEAFDFVVVEFARNYFAVYLFLAINHFCGFIVLAVLHVSHVDADDFLHTCCVGLGKMLFELRRNVKGINIFLLVLMATRGAGRKENSDAEDEEVR